MASGSRMAVQTLVDIGKDAIVLYLSRVLEVPTGGREITVMG